jgi:hypothetical protein
MFNIYGTAIFLMLFGFGQFKYVEHDLQPYVNTLHSFFKEECLPKKEFYIGLNSLPDTLAGRCYQRAFAFKIVIDSYTWSVVSESDKLQILGHEIAHCYFNEDHVLDNTNYMYANLRDLTILELYAQFKETLKKNNCLKEGF